MSRLIPLEKGIIFGPVQSRRLGVSIGINLLPTNKKFCSYDCLYCFYGYTFNIRETEWKKYLPHKKKVFDAINELVNKIQNGGINPNFITFAGNGEPTLHPDFPEVVDYLLLKISELKKKPGTALFTNATTFHSQRIFEASAKLDQTLVKIDLVDESTFQYLNRPFKKITIKEIAQIIANLSNLRIQTAVMKINGEIFNEQTLKHFVSLIKICSPIEVQLYNIIYPPADEKIKSVSYNELLEVKSILEKHLSIPIVIFDS